MKNDNIRVMKFNIQKCAGLLFFAAVLNSSLLFAQEIITAGNYLEMVAEQYGAIKDYEAQVKIRSGNSEMEGTISHLAPSFLRIDFSSPANQVIAFNGEELTVYLPDIRVTLSQTVNQSRRPAASGAGLASAQGLTMLRRNYVSSFVTGPNPEPLEDNSRERVVKLRLTRRSISEGFREIILSINSDTKLIRRIEAQSITDSEVRFDFTNIMTNQGIPEQRFVYDAPPSANVQHNFLFRDNE